MLNSVIPSKVFSDLPERLSAELFCKAPLHRLKTGQRLFSAGDPGAGCYRLEQGLIKVLVSSPQGEDRIFSILGPGSIVGELSMIDGLPRSATIVALQDCVFRFVSRETFDQCVQSRPEVCQSFLAALALRLRETNDALAASTFLSVKGRVARALLDLADSLGKKTAAGGITIPYKISQGDLAAMAGVARENVSRTMSEWRRRNLVTQSADAYCLKDRTALEQEMSYAPDGSG